jgi:hypothetical protein
MGVHFRQMAGQSRINPKFFKKMGTVIGFEKTVRTHFITFASKVRPDEILRIFTTFQTAIPWPYASYLN